MKIILNNSCIYHSRYLPLTKQTITDMKLNTEELKANNENFKRELSQLLENYNATIIAETNITIEFCEVKLGNGQTQPYNKINLGHYFN